ncbi:MAG: glycoside hydrolase family 28 protein, partial [Opitutaceae bacterium]
MSKPSQTPTYTRREALKTTGLALLAGSSLLPAIRMKLHGFVRRLTFFVVLSSASALEIDIRSRGAVPDGQTISTVAIQTAINDAAAAGGGTVVIEGGVFVSGTIELRSNVTLHVGPKATLKASGRLEDFPPLLPKEITATQVESGDGPLSGLLCAQNQRNIAITGSGIIDGNGSAFPKGEGGKKRRPRTVALIRCRDVRIEDVTTRHSATWTHHYLQCQDVAVRNITIHSTLPDRTNDGFDIEECHRVHISGSTIIADDDAIVLKSRMTSTHGTRDILIENCRVFGRKSAVKIGTETFGPIEN